MVKINRKVISSSLIIPTIYLGVVQLVERLIWDQEAAGSSPVTQTTTFRGLKLKTHFSKLIERLGNILHTNVNIILVQVIINLSLMDEATL